MSKSTNIQELSADLAEMEAIIKNLIMAMEAKYYGLIVVSVSTPNKLFPVEDEEGKARKVRGFTNVDVTAEFLSEG